MPVLAFLSAQQREIAEPEDLPLAVQHRDIHSVCLALVATLGCSSASSDVRLPRLIGDRMVLQRNEPVPVWGWADPGEKVQIDFHRTTSTVQADKKGKWSASLGPFPAGGPYQLKITGKNRIVLQDVLIGDVWLASGQSNMEWPVLSGSDQVVNAEEEVAAAKFPNIRLFAVERNSALQTATDVATKGWQAVTPESVASFSAVAYFFGRELHQRHKVPIGLIESDWGGTTAEAWISKSALVEFEDFKPTLELLQEKSKAKYEAQLQQKHSWLEKHGLEDRGKVDGRYSWADPAFNAKDWPTVEFPRPVTAAGNDFDGFGGVVWFRKEILLPKEAAGCDLTLRLDQAMKDDTTFFNGEKIGETQGYAPPRNYSVPGNLVRAGRNVVTVRLVGMTDAHSQYIGLFGPADKITAEACGTTVSLAGNWTYQPGPSLAGFPTIDSTLKAIYRQDAPPTTLFNGMIHPLISYRIKGVIWYQGESNADNSRRATQYRTLFPALIQNWREQWGYDFPFLFVQLAGFGPNKPEPAEYSWAELREAQSMALALAHTGMATAIDIGDEKDIHPRNKLDVGRRLALVAAKVAYGEDIVHSGPTYQSMKVEGDRVRIKYSSVGSGLLIKDKYGYVQGFEIAGADGRFVWAHATPDEKDILVFNDSIRQPVAVRYAWTNTPDGNVFNEEGLPALPFRTDAPQNPVKEASVAENR